MVNLGMAVLAAALAGPVRLKARFGSTNLSSVSLGVSTTQRSLRTGLRRRRPSTPRLRGRTRARRSGSESRGGCPGRDQKRMCDKPAPLPAPAPLRALRAFVTGDSGWYAVAGRLEPGDELRIAKLAREANRYVAESTASDPAAPSKEERDRAEKHGRALRRQLVLVSGDVPH